MEETKTLKLKHGDFVPVDYTGCVEFNNPTERRWFKNGGLHRTDGPAVEHADGLRQWYIKDQFIKSENGIPLLPGSIYKLSGRICGGSFFVFSEDVQYCLVLENKKEEKENYAHFYSKVLLNNSIVDLIFENGTFEKLE